MLPKRIGQTSMDETGNALKMRNQAGVLPPYLAFEFWSQVGSQHEQGNDSDAAQRTEGDAANAINQTQAGAGQNTRQEPFQYTANEQSAHKQRYAADTSACHGALHGIDGQQGRKAAGVVQGDQYGSQPDGQTERFAKHTAKKADRCRYTNVGQYEQIDFRQGECRPLGEVKSRMVAN